MENEANYKQFLWLKPQPSGQGVLTLRRAVGPGPGPGF